MSKHESKKSGPKTAEGKQRVSLNALKHGLHAKSPQAKAAAAADAELDYDKALDLVRSTYWPQDQMEDALVQRMAMSLSRLSMMKAMQQRMFERYSVRSRPGSDFESLLKAERMVSLELHRCIRSLAVKRASEFKIARATGKPESADELVNRFPWSVRSGKVAEPGAFGAPRQQQSELPSGTPSPWDGESRAKIGTVPSEAGGLSHFCGSHEPNDYKKSSNSVSSHEETEREIVPFRTPDSC